jgi:hypothetical protein
MVELATGIGDASERMQALISALRTYAPVGGAQLRRRRVDLSGAVEHARSAVSVDIREKDAEIRVGALPEVVDDERGLVQFMQNLLANALTFTAGVPKIEISAHRQATRWQKTVPDNGIGIAPEEATRRFEMFSRLHSQDVYPDTEIGLAICQRIVELHGGSITAAPRAGEGTAISFASRTTPRLFRSGGASLHFAAGISGRLSQRRPIESQRSKETFPYAAPTPSFNFSTIPRTAARSSTTLEFAGGHVERVWAVEDCRHVSGALERFLLGADETVIRVPPSMMVSERKVI